MCIESRVEKSYLLQVHRVQLCGCELLLQALHLAAEFGDALLGI